MDCLTSAFENFAVQNRRRFPAAALISVLFCALMLYFACQVWGPVKLGIFFVLFLLCTLQGLNGRPSRREGVLCGGFCLVFCFCLQIQGVLAASLGLAFGIGVGLGSKPLVEEFLRDLFQKENEK